MAQAGVKHSFVRLPEVGIHGNGHMMMLEKNNLQIAALLRGWIEKNVLKAAMLADHCRNLEFFILHPSIFETL